MSNRLPQISCLPPYVTFDTVESFIQICARFGTPATIDQKALASFSPSVRAQLRPSLRSLGLADERGLATGLLRNLARAAGTSRYPTLVGEMIDHAFPRTKKLDLLAISPSELSDAIAVSGCSHVILKRAFRFFLSGSLAAGRSLGPRLLYGRRVSSRSVSKPTVTRRRAVLANAESLALLREVIHKLPDFDSNWEPDVQSIWLRCLDGTLRAAARTAV
jgi:hypothetical protein